MVFTLIEHKNNVKMSQNVQNWSGTKTRRRVISMQSFDRFDAISMVDKDTNHRKLLSTGNFTITLTPLTFISVELPPLPYKVAGERKKKKTLGLRYACQIVYKADCCTKIPLNLCMVCFCTYPEIKHTFQMRNKLLYI